MRYLLPERTFSTDTACEFVTSIVQPAGVVRALCYNNNTNQTRVRLAGMIKVQKDRELRHSF